MNETVESIEGQIEELRLRKNKIEDAEFNAKTVPAIRAFLGQTFVYRNNSYSCPSSASDYWDVFRKVVRVLSSDGAAWLVYEECQIDRNGRPSLAIESYYARTAEMGSGWKPCTVKEYEKMRAQVVAAIDSPDTYVAYLVK
jgi:hypothetical protein